MSNLEKKRGVYPEFIKNAGDRTFVDWKNTETVQASIGDNHPETW
jgi:hypothetical protein